MIEIHNLTKNYDRRPVLRGLNMEVKKGEVYGLIGRNGAGKSTTMNILCGLLSRDGGTVAVNGKDPARGERVPVGYLPESPALYEYMNCYEYLSYIAAAAGYSGDVKKRIAEVVELVGLTDAAGRKIRGYSRGMKQRVGMAAALYSGQDLIVLDEPTSALDPQGRAEIMSIILTLRQMGKTVLLSTHILSDVERVADRVGFLHNGVITAESGMSSLLETYADPIISFSVEEEAPGLEDSLRALPLCDKTARNGNDYFVWYNGDKIEASQALFQFLAQKELPVTRYQLHRATLEQVYLKIIGQAAPAAASPVIPVGKEG